MPDEKVRENIVLFGGGLNCNVCADILAYDSRYNIVGIIDSQAEINSILHGYPVIGRQEDIVELVQQYKVCGGLITIGDNYSRFKLSEFILSKIPDFNFISAIHPSAVIAKNVLLGVNTIIMANAVVNPNCVIKNFCMVNTGAQIEHDCTLEDFVHVSCGTVTGGKVHIGKFSFITLHATILDRLTIGENCIVGSGAVLLKSLPDNVMAYGVPARIIKTIPLGYKILKSM